MRVVIAGGGNVGTFIAEDLVKAGHSVVIVEVDGDRVADACDDGDVDGVLVRVDSADPPVLVCHDGDALPIRWVDTGRIGQTGHTPGPLDGPGSY